MRIMDYRSYVNERKSNNDVRSKYFVRPVVPHSLRIQVLEQFHYPPYRRTRQALRKISQHFYWPQIFKDVTLFVGSCHPCNSRNSKSYLQGLLSSTPATSPTHRMSFDSIGPRTTMPEGFRWILVMINHFTKWLVAVPVRDRTSRTIINSFKGHWISESYAYKQVFADRAPELWTAEFRKLMCEYGSTFIPGPPHHS